MYTHRLQRGGQQHPQAERRTKHSARPSRHRPLLSAVPAALRTPRRGRPHESLIRDSPPEAVATNTLVLERRLLT